MALSDRFALCHGTLSHLSPPQFIGAAADAGFRRLSLRLFRPSISESSPTGDNFPMLGDTPMRRETKLRLADTGIEITEAEVVVLTPELDFRTLRPFLESAAYLECKGAASVLFGQQSAQQTVEAFAGFAQICAEYGLQPLIEFVSVSAVKTVTQAADMVVKAGVRNALICDSLHFVRGGSQLADLAEIDPSLIYSAQINDGPLHYPNVDGSWMREMLGGRRFLGEGEFPIREFVQHIPSPAPVGLEVNSKEFVNRKLTPLAMAAYAMQNLRDYFGLDKQ